MTGIRFLASSRSSFAAPYGVRTLVASFRSCFRTSSTTLLRSIDEGVAAEDVVADPLRHAIQL